VASVRQSSTRVSVFISQLNDTPPGLLLGSISISGAGLGWGGRIQRLGSPQKVFAVDRSVRLREHPGHRDDTPTVLLKLHHLFSQLVVPFFRIGRQYRFEGLGLPDNVGL
jgi:hypothetical protein